MSLIKTPPGRLCPLVKRPQKDCYCSNITSSNVESAILFCMGDYAECGIYQRMMEANASTSL